MGVPWRRRGKRMDEAIDIVRGLTSGGFFEFHGEFFDIPSVKMTPTPTEPVPLLVGGHSDPALRRAVRRGDGWMHAGGDGEELDLLLDKLAKYRDEEGVADRPFEVHVISMDAYTPDGVKRLEDRWIARCAAVSSACPVSLDAAVANADSARRTSARARSSASAQRRTPAVSSTDRARHTSCTEAGSSSVT
jgi:alkanesulfonate monooxygenase SsuD/methylene tetrahydromethanopterin reductase-like flavin-dependent oxidoreductase (luciferase family)